MIQSFSSYHKYGATENDANTPSTNDRNVHTVTVYFPVSFLKAGLAAFTMLVITVEHTIKIRIVFVMVLKNGVKILCLHYSQSSDFGGILKEWTSDHSSKFITYAVAVAAGG